MFEADATVLPRLMNCNGSHAMGGALAPFISGGDEGEAARYAAAILASGQATSQQLRGTKAPNGFFITDEILENVAEYVLAIKQDNAAFNAVWCDVSFATDRFKLTGIADHISFVGATLYIDKLVFGWGIVEPKDNWELLALAYGWLQRYGANAVVETIVMTIHQPRPSHVLGRQREWIIEGKDLLNRYGRSISEVLSAPSKTLRTGAAWCRKCPALKRCPAAREAAMNAVDVASQAQNEVLPDEMLGQELDALQAASAAIENRLKALQDDATYRLKNGAVISNYSLGSEETARKWNEGLDPSFIKMLTGLDVSVTKMITPTQAKALAKQNGIAPAVIDGLSRRDSKAPKLTRVSANDLAKHKMKGN